MRGEPLSFVKVTVWFSGSDLAGLCSAVQTTTVYSRTEVTHQTLHHLCPGSSVTEVVQGRWLFAYYYISNLKSARKFWLKPATAAVTFVQDGGYPEFVIHV